MRSLVLNAGSELCFDYHSIQMVGKDGLTYG